MRGTLWDIDEAIRGSSSCSWCNCWRKASTIPPLSAENAFAESFFKSLKCEELYLHHYQTFEEAQGRLQTFLEDVCNAKHLYSSFAYVPPDEFELKYVMC
jgi:hypothetical protein